MSAIDSLPSLPYAQQLRIIRDCISSRSQLAPMLGILAGLPDHEPLSQAFCQLAEAGLLDEVAPTLAHLFVSLPDTGIGRVLRGLGEAAINPRQHAHLVDALSAAVRSLPVERIAALCLMDRWLKNSAPESRAALIDEAFKQAEDALVRRAPVPHNVLLRIPGSRLATLDAVAQALSAQEAWSNTTAAFARQVLDLLQALPRSLSQANAEELLAKRVYTDPGHFLVELLQNAEDAAATHCIIAIDSDAARVWHNGVPFDAKDVVGVLSIGQTTKAREQIGFFGVGFKSVYEISERPRIDSGLFCFEIADVSIPRRLHPEPRPPHLPEGGPCSPCPTDPTSTHAAAPSSSTTPRPPFQPKRCSP